MEDAPPRDLDDEAQVERRWLLSFPIQAEISSGVSSGVSSLLVEMPDRTRQTARFHPESGLFRVELVGTRAELQEMELTVASGRAMTAKGGVIQLEDDAPAALGTLSLESAIWESDRATIQAGPVQLQTPAILGSLILEPAGVGGVSFDVTAFGPNGPKRVSVRFPKGMEVTSASLATFLPVTEWTARVTSGPAMASLPDWQKTAPAGADIVVPLSDTGGVQVLVNARHLPEDSMIVLVRLPAPKLTTISRGALRKRLNDQRMPSMPYASGIARLRLSPKALFHAGERLLPRGQYMVEVWNEEDETGELILVVEQQVVVHDRIVKVQID